ncbi:MAG: DNA repair protein RadA [bacterium]
MSKSTKTVFCCQSCGYQTGKWLGRCGGCGEWNSMVEEVSVSSSSQTRTSFTNRGQSLPINEINLLKTPRIKVKTAEVDRVLGGGIVPGSVILLGGNPGIGKSTLMLQAAGMLAEQNLKILYVSGEESQEQIKLRARRLEIDNPNLYVLTETCLSFIQEQVAKISPAILVIDSIQTTYTDMLQAVPGSISQVREVAHRLMVASKEQNLSTFLIGHVTKEGSLAGPKSLEHIVDTVLYLEGDRYHTYRILRSVKNRFGATNEIGVFEMRGGGMIPIDNPSEIFLQERFEHTPGSVVLATVEGSRPILVEIQALVSDSNYGVSKRSAAGVDTNRVALLLTVLEKRLELFVQNQDVFVNVVGGLRVDEPAIDLGVVAAIVSSFLGQSISQDTLVAGEVGLGGEVRKIGYPEERLKEAAKLGFKRCIIPEGNLKKLESRYGLEVIGINHVKELVQSLFP